MNGNNPILTHSIWYFLFSVVAGAAEALLSLFAPVGPGDAAFAVWSALPVPVVTAFVGTISFLGLFLDVPVFLGALAFLVLWKVAWVIVDLVRILWEFVPFF